MTKIYNLVMSLISFIQAKTTHVLLSAVLHKHWSTCPEGFGGKSKFYPSLEEAAQDRP